MITLAHVSDLHFGAELPKLAEALRRDVWMAAPSLVVVSGDLTQRARRGQFAAAREFLETLPGRRLVVPGNHDVPLYDVARRLFAPLKRFRAYIDEEVDPVFDDGEVFVAGLNTARSLTWKSGRISEAQITRLQERLLHTRARFKVVVTHHPFIPPPENERDARIDLVGRAGRALSVLDAGGVDLLLSGHLHHSYAGDTRTQYPAARRSIIAAQAGTAISRRVRDNDPNGYNLVRLDGDSITIEVRAWTGAGFEAASVTRYARGAAGWLAITGREGPAGGSPGPSG